MSDNCDNREIRDDITPRNVFVSWTKKDAYIKDAICKALASANISVLESKAKCAGNVLEWSIDAAASCDVFLLVLSDNSRDKKYVTEEFISAAGMDNASNRILPVCVRSKANINSGTDLYREFWKSFVQSKREKACPKTERQLKNWDELEHIRLPETLWHETVLEDIPDTGISDAALAEIVSLVKSLIINRSCNVYRKNTRPDYIKLIALCKQDIADRYFKHDSLYVGRSLVEEGENNYKGGDVKEYAVYDDPDVLFEDGVYYLHAAAGMGKSEYCGQISARLDKDRLCIILPCAETANSKKSLPEYIYSVFKSRLGGIGYFSEENFDWIFKNKKIVLVFDGLDEIATESGQRSFINKVAEYYKRNKQGLSLIFTGRDKKGAEKLIFEGERAKIFGLLPLNEDKINALGKNLFEAFGHREKCAGFFEQLSGIDEEIRTNPLLLTQLAIIYDENGKLPHTVAGILDSITQIILNVDGKTGRAIADVRDEYKGMLDDLGGILGHLARLQYESLFDGEDHAAVDLLDEVMSDIYRYPDHKARAEFLAGYLAKRYIFVGDRFGHKMFAEYFTAVCYCGQAFSPLKKFKDKEVVQDLFARYNEPYWENVIRLFAAKADSLINEAETEKLYDFICGDVTPHITDYTLLFDLCGDLLKNKTAAQVTVLKHILYRSAVKEYAPYGPLFYYVPEYDLYESLVLATAKLAGNAAALALTRDVCFITGCFAGVRQITDKVNGSKLYAAAKDGLAGTRDLLCRIFYLDDDISLGETDIYPRCFDPNEAYVWKIQGSGKPSRNFTPFEDELGLYSYPMLSEHYGEYIGLLALPADCADEAKILRNKPTYRVTTLVFGPTESDNIKFELPKFFMDGVKHIYLPENIVFEEQAEERSYIIKQNYAEYNGLLWRYDPNNVVIPAYFEYIPAYAFYGYDGLLSIDIPDSVTAIGKYAFERCENLKSVKFSENANLKTIGSNAFAGCSSLTSIEIPDSVTEIGDDAFYKCENLESVKLPKNLKTIGYSAFAGCSSLTLIDIPDSVTEIEWDAFENCKNLKSVKLSENLRTIGWNAFAGCSSLTLIDIPDSVTEIGDDAFSHCENLESVKLPKNLQTIGRSAFKCCSSLLEIKIPDSVMEIGVSAFGYCIKLESIKLSANLKIIWRNAFAGCRSLLEIIIPDSVTEIGDDAFFGCSNMNKIRLPERFKNKYYMFTLGEKVKIFFGDSEEYYKEDKEEQIEEFVIPQGLTRITRDDVTVRNMRRVLIPDSVTEIGDDAFSHCENLELVKLSENSNLNNIGSGAFSDCVSLSKIKIPDSVTGIGYSAFSECENLESVKLSQNLQTIGSNAFAGCSSLPKIEIPDSVTGIGHFAFEDCIKLESIKLSENLKTIGYRAFAGCSSLTSIEIPDSVTEIVDHAFENCKNLYYVKLSENLKTIVDGAFEGCSSLTLIDIPDSVTKIGDDAFEDCIKLESIIIPDSVEKISFGTFSGCTSLEEVKFGKNVGVIESEAFKGCSALKEINIPMSVYDIGKEAFFGCTALKKIVISKNFKKKIKDIFGDVDEKIITYF